MIWEKDYKNIILSNALEKRFPLFWKSLLNNLRKADIDFETTNVFPDIWLRDYLGISVFKNKMISFKYAPSYMKDPTKLTLIQEAKTKFEAGRVTHSSLIVDGGNCVFNDKYVILCKRVYKENSYLSDSVVSKELKLRFQDRKVIIIPDLKNDEFGHADGLVRFYNEDSVFVQDMRNSYSRRLIKQLEKHGLNIIKLPYYNNYKVTGNELSAKGYYINYLRLGDKIILPEFDVKEDSIALAIMTKHFGSNNVFPVNCNELAAEGGVLNCCSWTY